MIYVYQNQAYSDGVVARLRHMKFRINVSLLTLDCTFIRW